MMRYNSHWCTFDKFESTATLTSSGPPYICMQEDQGNRLSAETMHMQALLSLDSQKRNNIHLLDSNIVLTSAGTNVILLDILTCRPQYLPIPVSGGVGALAASTDSRCNPCILSSCNQLTLVCTDIW